jgi:glutamyl-tRNA reductase
VTIVSVGWSHRSASLDLLERVAVAGADVPALIAAISEPPVTGVLALSTCNRLELYADVASFHPGIDALLRAVAWTSGVEVEELAATTVVRHDHAAVAHLLTVACGLESIAVGEVQIIGQLRTALKVSQDAGRSSGPLVSLATRALRVAKHAHTDTDLDHVSPGLVDAGLARVHDRLGDPARLRHVVVGAGSMNGVTVATLVRAGCEQVTVVNRSHERAQHLASSYGVTSAAWDALADLVATADVVWTATGAPDYVVTPEILGPRSRPRVLVDLAMPRDVHPACAELPGVDVVDLDGLAGVLARLGRGSLADVRSMVAAEVDGWMVEQRERSIAPTVTALRSRADDIVELELARLRAKLGDDGEHAVAEAERMVHRVVDKLLHTPTVRVRELVDAPAESMSDALRLLFDLEPVGVGESPSDRSSTSL